MADKKIGVFPPEDYESRESLFDTLEKVFPVKFESRSSGMWSGLDGGIWFSDQPVPVQEAARQGLFCYVIAGGTHPETGRSHEIHFTASEGLDSRLRNQVLTERKSREFPPLPMEEGDAVRATVEGRPVWTARRKGAIRLDFVTHAPRNPAEGECLRDQITENEFMALLPLVHYLRELAGEGAWQYPPLRGSVILDDPNLHWRSYGFVQYADLVRHAEAHDYHISMAMIPFDGWFAHPGACRLFREHADRISLIMHGNNHTYEEFMQPMPANVCEAYIHQALSRIEKFESRTGVGVGRVMVAPHGRSSQEMLRAMLGSGIEAMISDSPHPWRPVDSRNPPEMPTARWEPAEMVVGGFPIIPRFCLLSYPNEEIVLRGFLNLPLIFAGHQWDLAWGLDILEERAGQVNALGSVRWMSPADIARTNYAFRRRGDTLQIRLFSRRARVMIPEGIQTIEVMTPRVHGQTQDEMIGCGDQVYPFPYVAADGPADPFKCGWSSSIPTSGPGEIEIQLRRTSPGEKPLPAVPPLGVWMVTRRILTESRDHFLPYFPKKYRLNYVKERIHRMLGGQPIRSKFIE